jgi:hypothetical protein
MSDTGRQIVELEAQIAALVEDGGGGLPSQWTVGLSDVPSGFGDGALQIELDSDGFALNLVSPTGHEFAVDLQSSSPKISFELANGAEARIENDASVYLYGRDNGSSNPWLWFYRTVPSGPSAGQKNVTIDLRSDAANRQTIFDDDGNAVFQIRTDGSIHVKTGAATALVADL